MGSSSGQQAGRWLSGPWAFLPGRSLTRKSLEQPFVPDPLAVQVSLFPEGATGCVCFCSFLSVELETPKTIAMCLCASFLTLEVHLLFFASHTRELHGSGCPCLRRLNCRAAQQGVGLQRIRPSLPADVGPAVPPAPEGVRSHVCVRRHGCVLVG